jgi:thiol-disulfide isomerase/thioredoxin
MRLILISALFFLATQSLLSQDVKPLNEEGMKDLLDSMKGSTLVINFWATWCKPCVEEFPELLKIREDYKEKNVQLLLISLDFGEDAEERTVKFLNESGVNFTTYSNSFNKDEDLMNFFDKGWGGAIPATFIFDKEGKLRASLIGKRKYEDFSSELNKVL